MQIGRWSTVTTNLLGIALLLASTHAMAIWPLGGVYRFDSISGTVMDIETRKPLENVVVVVHWGLERKLGFEGTAYAGPLAVVETVTDKEGKFKTPSVTASDIGKTGHYNSERYPQIAFFKSEYELTAYRHSGIEPISSLPEAPQYVLKDDEYFIPRLPNEPKQIEKVFRKYSRPLTLIDISIICVNYAELTPKLLGAMQDEQKRLAKLDDSIWRLFANTSGLSGMESCLEKIGAKR